MTTIVALTRHGQTDWNSVGKFQGSSDIPLNETGLEQASLAVPFLRSFIEERGTSWDMLRYSPLQRAAETGRIIADALDIEDRQPMPALVERDWGGAEGRTKPEINERYPQLVGLPQRQARDAIPGVEPRRLVIDRGMFALTALTELYPNNHIIATTHGSILRYTVEHILGGTLGVVPNLGVVVLELRLENGRRFANLLDKSF